MCTVLLFVHLYETLDGKHVQLLGVVFRIDVLVRLAEAHHVGRHHAKSPIDQNCKRRGLGTIYKNYEL